MGHKKIELPPQLLWYQEKEQTLLTIPHWQVEPNEK